MRAPIPRRGRRPRLILPHTTRSAVSTFDALSRLARSGALELEKGFEAIKAELGDALARGPRAAHLQTYRGYGTRERLHLFARALRGRPLDPSVEGQSTLRNLLDSFWRFETDEIPGAAVRARFGTVEHHTTTDEEGYVEFVMEVSRHQTEGDRWQSVEMSLDPGGGDPRTTALARVLVPGAEAEYGVISDIDDTVLVTGATRLRSLLKLTLLHNARTRLPFEGVGGLYRALEQGSDGQRLNPFFYVSSSPWNLYGLLDEFFARHRLPEGPILLRDLGLAADHWVSGDHDHKRRRIEDVLATFPALAFVLIGDSGQADPEIYAAVATANPGRVRAVLIRDVSEGPRSAAVRDLATATTAAGTPMLVVRDSGAAAELAVDLGLIPPAAVDRVAAARQIDQGSPTAAELLEDEGAGDDPPERD